LTPSFSKGEILKATGFTGKQFTVYLQMLKGRELSQLLSKEKSIVQLY
jgi:hypothetical protein